MQNQVPSVYFFLVAVLWVLLTCGGSCCGRVFFLKAHVGLLGIHLEEVECFGYHTVARHGMRRSSTLKLETGGIWRFMELKLSYHNGL